jgi:predicted AlkP superfamily phosphohydrolase/phosphomutase
MATRIDDNWFKQRIQDVKFLSPNEPLTIQGIHRVLQEMQDLTKDVKDRIGVDSIGKAITMWDSTVSYNKGDVVLYFRKDNEDTVEQGKREFVFLLMSTFEKPNNAMPGYDMVDGIPDFSKTNWVLLNPMSYLLQDLNELRKVVVEVFRSLLDEHVAEDHGLIGANEIESNLLRKDYSNL